MQHGKFVVKAKATKFHRKEFDREVAAKRERDKIKHSDKALWRSKREEQREDYNNFPIDDGY